MRVLLGSLTALFAGGSALAADLPVYKAPPAAVAQVWSWTGFYVGANAGYSVGRDRTSPADTYTLVGFQPNLPINTPVFTSAPAGGVAGGQLGYNWQTGSWVLGLEGDLQWSGQQDTYCGYRCLTTTQDREIIERKLTWFGTARGRIGYAAGPALFYATGGAAFGGVRTDDAETVFADPVQIFGFSHTKSGFAVGGGVEAVLVGNWTVKAEYLYLDLGSIQDSFRYTGPNSGVINNVINSEVRDHIFRAGLNYNFGQHLVGADGAPGLTAKAPVKAQVYNWTGFYIGANAGYGVANDPTSNTWVQYGINDQFHLNPAGGLVGGQFGYNWQSGSLVFGLEGDAQWSGQRDTACVAACRPFVIPNAGVSSILDQKLTWLGTARGRIGYAAGPALFYLTAGGAWGEVKTNITDTSIGEMNNFVGITQSFAGAFAHTKGGYAVGGGVEAALAGNWTAKAEFLRVDLGSVTDGFTANFDPVFGGPITHITSYSVRDNIFRVGLNYKFGQTPVVARY